MYEIRVFGQVHEIIIIQLHKNVIGYLKDIKIIGFIDTPSRDIYL